MVKAAPAKQANKVLQMLRKPGVGPFIALALLFVVSLVLSLEIFPTSRNNTNIFKQDSIVGVVRWCLHENCDMIEASSKRRCYYVECTTPA